MADLDRARAGKRLFYLATNDAPVITHCLPFFSVGGNEVTEATAVLAIEDLRLSLTGFAKSDRIKRQTARRLWDLFQ